MHYGHHQINNKPAKKQEASHSGREQLSKKATRLSAFRSPQVQVKPLPISKDSRAHSRFFCSTTATLMVYFRLFLLFFTPFFFSLFLGRLAHILTRKPRPPSGSFYGEGVAYASSGRRIMRNEPQLCSQAKETASR